MTHAFKYKDYKLRKNLKNFQENILLLKFFLLKEKLDRKTRFKIMLKFQRTYKGLFGVRYKNCCIFSTKTRSISRISNLHKSFFREYLR